MYNIANTCGKSMLQDFEILNPFTAIGEMCRPRGRAPQAIFVAIQHTQLQFLFLSRDVSPIDFSGSNMLYSSTTVGEICRLGGNLLLAILFSIQQEEYGNPMIFPGKVGAGKYTFCGKSTVKGKGLISMKLIPGQVFEYKSPGYQGWTSFLRLLDVARR